VPEGRGGVVLGTAAHTKTPRVITAREQGLHQCMAALPNRLLTGLGL